MDKDGYPTDEELETIELWAAGDFHGLMGYIYDLWKYADCGYWKQEGNKYSISTGGWSGNEDIIGAMQKNVVWWMLYWESSIRGGHYIFKPIRE